jgi:hypothetical protein
MQRWATFQRCGVTRPPERWPAQVGPRVQRSNGAYENTARTAWQAGIGNRHHQLISTTQSLRHRLAQVCRAQPVRPHYLRQIPQQRPDEIQAAPTLLFPHKKWI